MACTAEIDRILSHPKYRDPLRLEPFGYKVYSQHDEDGMLAEALRRIEEDVPRSFVEFGVGNGLENNSLFLLKQGWKGLWIEGSPENAKAIRKSFAGPLDSGKLCFSGARINRDNINALISPVIQGDVGLLSIDIDGNDYYVWERIEVISPFVVIIEYNAKFAPPVRWAIEYTPNHVWDRSDYQGASLAALDELGERKGYQLVGCNLNGTNAFFVRKDLLNAQFLVSNNLKDYYHPPRYYLFESYLLMAGHRPDPRLGRVW